MMLPKTENAIPFSPDLPVYYLQHRDHMLRYIPRDVKKICEPGCAAGVFGSLVKQKFHCEYWGIEPHPEAAAAAEKVLDRVICEPFDEHTDLEGNTFDCFVFNDVLEHMVDPWSVLKFCRGHLNPGGIIVSSIPNFLSFSNVKEILFTRDWKYESSGIRDKTHLRFFTRKSMIRMFEETGYEVIQIEGLNPKKKYTFKILNALLLNRLEDMRYLQYAVVARAAAGPSA
ncbi:MAG: class I SAM-dependent methyltransferase [Phaeodactylibacter sp.]|nr:class I SAM-dependent methyltransferase [Phaeodactylibacter sp.]